MLNIPSAHPHYCLLFHSTPNNGFVHKSTAHRKVPLHTNAVHPLIGHIHRTIEDPDPVLYGTPIGSISRVPQCQPHCTPQSQKYLQSQHLPHHDRTKCLSTEMRTERHETERGTHKIKDCSAEHTHAQAAHLERWDGDSNRLLFTRLWAQACRI